MGDVISSATRLILRNPAIIIIQLIPAIPTLLSDVLVNYSILSIIVLLADILSIVLAIMASGAYVPIVQAELTNQQWSIGDAFSKAYHRFWDLLLAGIIVGIIVVLGFIALVVPGLILLTWYVYTVPAIMSEDKGATSAMSASKAFGRDKKWATFLMFLVFIAVYLLFAVIESLIPSATGGRVVDTILTVPLEAWVSVTIAYTYLTHGPNPVTSGGAAQQVWPQIIPPNPPATSTPPPPVEASRFCSNCGSALQPGAKFCPSCGKAV